MYSWLVSGCIADIVQACIAHTPGVSCLGSDLMSHMALARLGRSPESSWTSMLWCDRQNNDTAHTAPFTLPDSSNISRVVAPTSRLASHFNCAARVRQPAAARPAPFFDAFRSTIALRFVRRRSDEKLVRRMVRVEVATSDEAYTVPTWKLRVVCGSWAKLFRVRVRGLWSHPRPPGPTGREGFVTPGRGGDHSPRPPAGSQARSLEARPCADPDPGLWSEQGLLAGIGQGGLC